MLKYWKNEFDKELERQKALGGNGYYAHDRRKFAEIVGKMKGIVGYKYNAMTEKVEYILVTKSPKDSVVVRYSVYEMKRMTKIRESSMDYNSFVGRIHMSVTEALGYEIERSKRVREELSNQKKKVTKNIDKLKRQWEQEMNIKVCEDE